MRDITNYVLSTLFYVKVRFTKLNSNDDHRQRSVFLVKMLIEWWVVLPVH